MMLHHFALRAVVALLLGFLIGAERQWRQRTAGIRTNSLVALGSSRDARADCLADGS